MSNSLQVLLEGSDNTVTAKLLRSSVMYNSSEYELEDGSRFFIDHEYIQECKTANKPPTIPLEVIRHRREQLEKLALAQQLINKQAKEAETGLVLPDGFKV